MEKEKAMLNMNIDPEVFKEFKISLIRKGITIGEWVEQKVIEEVAINNTEVK